MNKKNKNQMNKKNKIQKPNKDNYIGALCVKNGGQEIKLPLYFTKRRGFYFAADYQYYKNPDGRKVLKDILFHNKKIDSFIEKEIDRITNTVKNTNYGKKLEDIQEELEKCIFDSEGVSRALMKEAYLNGLIADASEQYL